MKEKKYKKWTDKEEKILFDQVRALPQNLTKCFLIVSELVDRTPGAVSNHWYTVTSKRPEFVGFFTASQKHVSINRKNGYGQTSTATIWKRLMRIIKQFIG